MSITLDQMLSLVGKLDDSGGEEVPRERFRRFLKDNIKDIADVRDYIEECLRKSGDQHNRALQDLVNFTGSLIGFDVTYGRYQGTRDSIGFDGHWVSPTGFHIVAEVKTTEVYAVKTSTLTGYVDQLISEKRIPNWSSALGLYVVGRPDPEIRQLEHAIVAEERTQQLRVISVESLLSLAEMTNEYDVTHQDMLAIIKPSGPRIDAVVDLVARMVAQEEAEKQLPPEQAPSEELVQPQAAFWISPVRSSENQTAEEVIQTLVGQEKVYAYAQRTPGRKYLKPGDWVCFYATQKGVVAKAEVQSRPEQRKHPAVEDPEKYCWVFRLGNTKLWLDKPVVIDAKLRAQLDVFRGWDTTKSWAWFVQATRKVTKHDFDLLTGASE